MLEADSDGMVEPCQECGAGAGVPCTLQCSSRFPDITEAE